MALPQEKNVVSGRWRKKDPVPQNLFRIHRRQNFNLLKYLKFENFCKFHAYVNSALFLMKQNLCFSKHMCGVKQIAKQLKGLPQQKLRMK